MNKRIQRMVEPGMRLFLLVLIAFAVATLFFEPNLALAEAAVILILIVYSLLDARKRRRQLVEYIESVTYDAESAKNNTLMNFPLPIVVFGIDNYQIIWGNQIFFDLFGSQRPSFGSKLTDMVPGFNVKWLMEGKNQYPGLIQVGDRKYQLHGNIIRSRSEELDNKNRNFMGITYWVDVTDFDNIKQEYEYSRPVSMVIQIDNYDELMKGLTDRQKTDLRGEIDDHITQWCEGKQGLIRRYDRDRYMFIFENRYLEKISRDKFDILESIHSIVNPTGIHATLSIGVGKDGSGFEEDFAFANLSVDMALQRGGDQAVIKNKYNFEFFGGRNTEVETRSNVKSRVTANALAELMRASSQIYVMGHKFSDMDCVGGAAGMLCIARKLEKNARIVLDVENSAAKKLIEAMKETAEYRDAFISPDEALLKADSKTLLVVVDTNRPEQVESRSLLEACNRVAVIDHHRRAASYIQNAALTFHEPYASSVCELISEILQELVEQKDIKKIEAEAILTGIVLDTKNFTIRTGERTFEDAAFLRRMGADTAEVKRMLQSDIDSTFAKYNILQSGKIYRGNIAIAVSELEQDRIVAAQAADELLNVSGVEASFVVYAEPDNSVIISGRSIGDVNVQLILERLGGGGNKSAAGAQVKDRPLREAVNTLCAAIDEYLDN